MKGFRYTNAVHSLEGTLVKTCQFNRHNLAVFVTKNNILESPSVAHSIQSFGKGGARGDQSFE